MQIPKRIFFKERTPRGGKLAAFIIGDELPTSIKVKGTNDIGPVQKVRERRGNDCNDRDERDERDRDRNGCRESRHRLRYVLHGVLHGHGYHHGGGGGHDHHDHDDEDFNECFGRWESRNKYASLQQTLIFIKNGVVLAEASYDATGKLIEETTGAVIKDNSITLTEGVVDFTWTAVKEVNVIQYNSEKKAPGDTEWSTLLIDRPQGAGTVYSAQDIPTVGGETEYRLRVIYNDADKPEEVLMSKTLSITDPNPGPDAEIEYFTVTPPAEGGATVHLEWKSTKEVEVLEYRYERQVQGAPDFTPIDNPAGAQGEGLTSGLDDTVSELIGVGVVVYRLKAIFVDGDEDPTNNPFEILGTQSVML